MTSGGNPPASDRRLKENIEIIDNATDAIRKINGY
ncbi:tail fiber domain-containing protein, partial [Escherichia coli]